MEIDGIIFYFIFSSFPILDSSTAPINCAHCIEQLNYIIHVNFVSSLLVVISGVLQYFKYFARSSDRSD